MSAAQVINGTTGLLAQPTRYGWDPQRGHWAEWEWEAAGDVGKQNIRALGAQLSGGNVQYSVAESFGKSTLTAQFGSDPFVSYSSEVPILSWSTQTNRVGKEIYQIAKVQKYQSATAYPITVVNGLTNALMVLRSCVEAKSLTAALDAGIPTSNQISGYEDWNEAFDLLMSGYTEQAVEQSILIRTSTVSSNYARTILQSNVGCVFTPAQMLSLEGAPNTIVENIALPAGFDPFVSTNPGYGFLYGYRKSRPSMQPAPFNKWTVETQWEQGIFSMFLTDPAS